MSNQAWCFACFFIAVFFIFALYLFNDQIQLMHINGDAYWFASDPGEYMRLYDVYAKTGASWENFTYLFIIGAPIMMLLISKGSVFPVLILACSLFFTSLYSCLKFLPRSKGKFFFIMIINPVVLLGFFAINKEIFLISSILFFLAYYNSLNWKYLCLCLVAILFARVYMVVVYAFILIVFPPTTQRIRWKVLLASLIFVTISAPFVLNSGKIGSSSTLLDGAGSGALFFSEAIRNYLYGLIYLPKYLFLIIMRVWSAYVSGFLGEYKSNLRDLLTSIYSLIIISYSVISWHRYKSNSFKYLMIAIWSPLPLMFSDIVHWRYYIFVLPIFVLYNIVKTRDPNKDLLWGKK